MPSRDPHAINLPRFLLRHALVGIAVAVVLVGVCYVTNTANLRVLVEASDVGVFALCVMTLLFGVTFGSAQMGFALMLWASAQARPPAGRAAPLPAVEPVRS